MGRVKLNLDSVENSKTKIVKWDLKVDNFPGDFSVEGLHDDYEGFRILIKGGSPSRVFKFTFESYLSYRNTDESDRIMSLDDFPETIKNWSLFKASDSSFIDWLVKKSGGVSSAENITHYIFITQNDVIDVLSSEEPVLVEL